MAEPDNDLRQRFIFADSDIRGEIVSLQDSYQQILANGDYPAPVAQLLGEFLAAICLLSATLKFNGTISMHAAGTGALTTITAECARDNRIRGVALCKPGQHWPATASPVDLLGADATLAVTVEPASGKRYQSIIPIAGNNLSECLSAYFRSSEQLSTAIILGANGRRAGGLLLQKLPAQLQAPELRDRYWTHLCHLADTLSASEQVSLGHSEQLFRLFNQEALQLFDPTGVQFACSCSKARTANMLAGLGKSEVSTLLKERRDIEVTCQFCNQLYTFDKNDARQLFEKVTPTLH